MIYNSRNWSNDTTENQTKKTCFNGHDPHAEGKLNLAVQCKVNKQISKLYIFG